MSNLFLERMPNNDTIGFGSSDVIILPFLLQTWVKISLPFDQVCLSHREIQQYPNHPVAEEESKNEIKEGGKILLMSFLWV